MASGSGGNGRSGGRSSVRRFTPGAGISGGESAPF